MDKVIVDGDTGETIGELNQGDRIVRAASYRSRKDIYIEDINKDKIHWEIKDFFKTSAQEQRLWLPLLSHMERSFLFAVTTYISYDNDLQDDDKKQIGTEELILLTGISRNAIYPVIGSLIHKDILYRGRNSKGIQYFINPWLTCKGGYIRRDLHALFKNYRIKVLGNKRWGDMKYDD